MYKEEKKNVDQIVSGVVADVVYKLNVREEPDIKANIIYEADAGSKFLIDISKSTEDWFSVCNSCGIEGFCMKKYIIIKE